MFLIRIKNVPCRILAPAAVACDTYLVRRSAHPERSVFCILGKDFPNIQKNGLCNAQSVILVENTRVELVTSCLQGRRSPN